MIIGLFPSANHAAVCLSNLAEAEFPEDAISVVAQGAHSAEELAQVSGPLNGLSVEALSQRLAAMGMAPNRVATYAQAIRQGQIFLAVSAEGADAVAREILSDHGAQQLCEVRPG